MSQAADQAAIARRRARGCGPPTSSTLDTSRASKANSSASSRPARRCWSPAARLWGRTEIVLKGEARWVTAGYLSDDKPLGAGAGLSMEPCPDGGVESGLHRQRGLRLPLGLRTPSRRSLYGGCEQPRRARQRPGDRHHGQRRRLGTAIAEFLRAHVSELDLYDVIWRQHIWTGRRGRRGLAVHVRRGLGDGQPLRPRARHGLLTVTVGRRRLT